MWASTISLRMASTRAALSRTRRGVGGEALEEVDGLGEVVGDEAVEALELLRALDGEIDALAGLLAREGTSSEARTSPMYSMSLTT